MHVGWFSINRFGLAATHICTRRSCSFALVIMILRQKLWSAFFQCTYPQWNVLTSEIVIFPIIWHDNFFRPNKPTQKKNQTKTYWPLVHDQTSIAMWLNLWQRIKQIHRQPTINTSHNKRHKKLYDSQFSFYNLQQQRKWVIYFKKKKQLT